MKLFLALVLILIVGGFVVVFTGVYNVSTNNHDNGVINWVMDTAMTRSVQEHAKGITAPSLSDPAMIQMGFRHYRAMCVDCHGAPGVHPEEIAKGLFPDAPDLAKTAGDWKPAELYWIIKNGIKFTAMPAWGPTHDEKALWAMTAFVAKLPRLSPEEWKAMDAQAPRHREGGPEGAAHESQEH